MKPAVYSSFMQPYSQPKPVQRGLTLIELMVGIAVGLVVTLVVFTVLSLSEGRKRTLTGTNDINQAGNYALAIIDKLVRSSGSGFRANPEVYGCKLMAARSSTQILPAPSLPAPFKTLKLGSGTSTATTADFRLAPILIASGQTTSNTNTTPSDVLIVMQGTSGSGDIPLPFIDNPPAVTDTLPVKHSIGLQPHDLVLVANKNSLDACMVEEVGDLSATDGSVTVIPTASQTYSATTINSVKLSDVVSSQSIVINLGNITNNNAPQFQVIGVGDNNTLFTYDLLQTTGATTAQALADGVFEMQALYGIDIAGNNQIKWVKPDDTDYSISALMAGTPAAAERLKLIKAIRVGLIMRTSVPEKTAVSPATLPALFSELVGADGSTSLAYQRKLTTAEQNFRYRVLEFTIPIRNNLLP